MTLRQFRMNNHVVRARVFPTMLFLFGACAGLALAASGFDTKTKVRLAENGVWLETEIAPQALLAALPQTDRNSDQRLEEEELSASRGAILSYYAQKVQLVADDRWLKADSTYFAFRSPALPTAVPDRFYIYHWYAVLRRPAKLQLTNRLFQELDNSCLHQGAVIDGDKILKFDFPVPETANGAETGRTVTIALGKSGEVSVVDTDAGLLQSGYLWFGLGLSGLGALRMASLVRKKWRRQQKTARPAHKTATLEIEEQAVFN